MTLRPRRAIIVGGGALGAAALVPAAGRAAAASPRPVTLLSTYVAGTGYDDAPAAAARLAVGDALVLRRCPDSGYDPRAIEVRSADGARLGCVPRIDNQALARLMDEGLVPEARVSAIDLDGARPEIRLDVTVEMMLPNAVA